MAKEIKFDKSESFVVNFHEGRQDAYYLSTVIFNDGKREEMKIDADEKGYYLYEREPLFYAMINSVKNISKNHLLLRKY